MTTATRERTCPLCGSEANSPHHIIPRSEGGGEGRNVVYLCQKCHDEIEEKWDLFVDFLRFYAEKRERKVPAKWEEPKVRRIKLGPVGTGIKVRKARETYIPPEGTPSWLARELGVSSTQVTIILNQKYPRSSKEKWQDWGILNEEQQTTVREALVELLRHKDERGAWIPREGTPNWLAGELGVTGRMVRRALRLFFPRPEEKKRSDWGSLTQEMQVKLKELVVKYNEDNKGHSKVHGKSWSFLLDSELNKIS